MACLKHSIILNYESCKATLGESRSKNKRDRSHFSTHYLTPSTPSSPFSRMYQVVKLLYCFGIFITFALQFYVPAEILIPSMVACVPDQWDTAIDLLLRAVMVIFTCKYERVCGVSGGGLLNLHTMSGSAATCFRPRAEPSYV